MSVNLYDSHYGQLHTDVQREIRLETYGEDLGQSSWITLPEYQRFLAWLDIQPGARALEIACGSGGLSVRLAEDTSAEVTGVDINDAAIAQAQDRIRQLPGDARVRFQCADANRGLPFQDQSFDIVLCNDSINHIRDRGAILRDCHRVLRHGGLLLYTDPIVVTGILSNEEIAARSSIGFFLFVPVGENERLLRDAGFDVVRVENVTDAVADVASRWHEARRRRREQLLALDGEAAFESLQRFLKTVHTLARDRRLSRFAFLAQR